MLGKGDNWSLCHHHHPTSGGASSHHPRGFGLDPTGALKNEERTAVTLKLNVFTVCSIDEDTGQLIPVGGLCRRAVSGRSHLGRGSCGWYFLNTRV